jgi:chaperonin GroES
LGGWHSHPESADPLGGSTPATASPEQPRHSHSTIPKGKSLEAEQTTASGLVIPDTAKEKPQEGEVLAVGPGRIDDKGNRVPLDISVGDRVIYSKYGGTEIKHKGDEFLILSARDVLAVVA